MRQVKTDYFVLEGGLNLTTPPIRLPEGMVRDSINFDSDIDGGYRYISGYERFDGRLQPSEANYFSVRTSEHSYVIASGQTVSGVTSGAHGLLVGHGTNFISLTAIQGTFISGEGLSHNGFSFAVTQSTVSLGGAGTVENDAIYKAISADIRRQSIQAVTGSGPILGVWRYGDEVYAFRNNVTATEAIMWKATPTGWQQVNFGYEVSFSNANNILTEGQNLIQGPVSAVINKVIVETGSLDSGTNTGKLHIQAPSGGIFAVGPSTTSEGASLQIAQPSTAIALLPNGKFSFANYNFGGLASTQKMYGCDGVNRAFEFDGTNFIPITTGMVNDAPKHIVAHTNRLFLAFDASLQYSAVGQPFSFNAIIGAGELGVGDEITSLISLIGSDSSQALAVFTKDKTSILYGNSNADFQLVTFSLEAGANAYSVRSVGQVYVMDYLGVRQLGATQGFGNFISTQITKYIKPYVNERKDKVIGSAISRLKNQYRLYFSDGTALHITVDNEKIVGIMPLRFNHTFTCISSHEGLDGGEYILAGSNNGFVYRLDRGTSFDGQSINASMTLAFHHIRSPRLRKRYRKAVFEVTGTGYSRMNIGYEVGYASNNNNQGGSAMVSSDFGGVYWDAFTWDNFYWDGKNLLPSEISLGGDAENISLAIRASSNAMPEFTINSVIIHHSDGRLLR